MQGGTSSSQQQEMEVKQVIFDMATDDSNKLRQRLVFLLHGQIFRSSAKKGFHLTVFQFQNFLQYYNKLTELCFTDCIHDFTNRKISANEVSMLE